MSEHVSSEDGIARHEDWDWAYQRVTDLCASALIDASRLGRKILKGFGYPNEIFRAAQDYRALSIVLAEVSRLAAALAEQEQQTAAWKATADRFRVENGDLRGYLGQIDGTRRELTKAVQGNALAVVKSNTASAERIAQLEASLAAQAQEIEKYKALYLEDEQELHEKEQEIEELKAERAESRRWKTLQAKHELEKELAAVRQELEQEKAAHQHTIDTERHCGMLLVQLTRIVAVPDGSSLFAEIERLVQVRQERDALHAAVIKQINAMSVARWQQYKVDGYLSLGDAVVSFADELTKALSAPPVLSSADPEAQS